MPHMPVPIRFSQIWEEVDVARPFFPDELGGDRQRIAPSGSVLRGAVEREPGRARLRTRGIVAVAQGSPRLDEQGDSPERERPARFGGVGVLLDEEIRIAGDRGQVRRREGPALDSDRDLLRRLLAEGESEREPHENRKDEDRRPPPARGRRRAGGSSWLDDRRPRLVAGFVPLSTGRGTGGGFIHRGAPGPSA